MGEAKRKAAARAHAAGARSWATGFVVVWANDAECFNWSGTKQDAINLQKKFLDAANTLGIECQSYATEAACYAMTFGMPQAGPKIIVLAGSARRGMPTKSKHKKRRSCGW